MRMTATVQREPHTAADLDVWKALSFRSRDTCSSIVLYSEFRQRGRLYLQQYIYVLSFSYMLPLE